MPEFKNSEVVLIQVFGKCVNVQLKIICTI